MTSIKQRQLDMLALRKERDRVLFMRDLKASLARGALAIYEGLHTTPSIKRKIAALRKRVQRLEAVQLQP